jgi:hypothetical protein
MQLQPVQKHTLNDIGKISKFFYAMALLGQEEFPIRVLVQRYAEKEGLVQVQPTTCNTGKSVWIGVHFLLEDVANSSYTR